MQRRLPQLLKIAIRIHELDLVHQIQGRPQFSMSLFIPLALL